MKFCFNLDRPMRDRCFTPDALRRLGQWVDLDPEAPEKLTPAWLHAHASDCDGLIGGWGSLPIDGALLDAAPRLRLVLYSAGTVKGVATPAMWRRGVRITSAANVNGVPVAEFSLGLILMCFRGVWAQQHRFRTRGRAGWDHPPVMSYYGSTVGLIGMGNVGKALLGLLASFQFRKLVHSSSTPRAGRWWTNPRSSRNSGAGV